MNNELRSNLIGMPKAYILDLFKTINGGAVGFDHERTRKTECVDRLLNTFSVQQIEAAMQNTPTPVIDVEDVTPKAPAAKAAPAPAMAGNFAEQIGNLFATMAASAVDESKVRAIVDEVIGQRVPRAVEIRRPNGEAVRLEERVHPQFDKVVKLASAGVNVMLVGPAGCGKTHLAHQVAKALGKTFGSISGSAGVSEAHLTGRLLPTGENGRFEYTESPFSGSTATAVCSCSTKSMPSTLTVC